MTVKAIAHVIQTMSLKLLMANIFKELMQRCIPSNLCHLSEVQYSTLDSRMFYLLFMTNKGPWRSLS